MKVLITPRSFPKSGQAAYALLREKGFEVIDNNTGKSLTEEEMIKMCVDVDGLIVGVDPVTRTVMEHAKNLKAISKYGAGLDNVDLEAAKELGIAVDRAAGTNAVSVAEHAVGLFFSLARSVVPTAMSTKNGEWGREQGVELFGKTAGIVGLGNIGKNVARMCKGIGMNILGFDPYLPADDPSIAEYGVKMVSLEELFREADFISLHSPLTDETANMINKDSLATMKKTACIVNTARGGLVNEDDLYEALKNGTIKAVAEDVFSTEPPAKDNKLVALPNFVLTSHIGAFTAEANQKMALKSAENLVRMICG